MRQPAAVVAPKPRLRGVSHLVAFAIWVPISTVLVITAPSGAARFGALVYVLGVGSMLGVSALYHLGGWSPSTKATLSKLDHCTIFLAIAGTYTPIAIVSLQGAARTVSLVVVWSATLLGIVVQWLPLAAPRWVSTGGYALVGWCAVVVLPQLWTGLSPAAFFLVLAGGLFYTLGAVVYALRKPDPWPATFGYHEVFHACTIIALVLHLLAIAFFVLPEG